MIASSVGILLLLRLSIYFLALAMNTWKRIDTSLKPIKGQSKAGAEDEGMARHATQQRNTGSASAAQANVLTAPAARSDTRTQ